MVKLLIELEAQIDAVSEYRSNALFQTTLGGCRFASYGHRDYPNVFQLLSWPYG